MKIEKDKLYKIKKRSMLIIKMKTIGLNIQLREKARQRGAEVVVREI